MAKRGHRDGHVLDDVSRQENDPVGGQLREQAVESQAFLGIEPGGGLVDDDQSRVAGDCLGDSQPLAHSPRVGLDLAPGRERQVHPFQQFVAQHTHASRRTDAFEPQEVFEHLRAGQVREETEVLRQIAQPAPDPLRLLEHRLAVERCRARARLEQAGQNAHQGRLARPVGAQQSKHPVGHIQVDPGQCRHRPGINLHQVAYDQHHFPFCADPIGIADPHPSKMRRRAIRHWKARYDWHIL